MPAATPATIRRVEIPRRNIELQTRLIEEPWLLAVHGEQYAAYATQVVASSQGSAVCGASAPLSPLLD